MGAGSLPWRRNVAASTRLVPRSSRPPCGGGGAFRGHGCPPCGEGLAGFGFLGFGVQGLELRV
jgi:hypothetical protein